MKIYDQPADFQIAKERPIVQLILDLSTGKDIHLQNMEAAVRLFPADLKLIFTRFSTAQIREELREAGLRAESGLTDYTLFEGSHFLNKEAEDAAIAEEERQQKLVSLEAIAKAVVHQRRLALVKRALAVKNAKTQPPTEPTNEPVSTPPDPEKNEPTN